jgi:AcrR family transcriptional regulator
MRSLRNRLDSTQPEHQLATRDLVAQHQRERMLAATAELVAKRGYQGTTIELIAKTARVALSTFYEHFANKEECFLAAFDETVEAATEALRELVGTELPWEEQVSKGVAVLLEMVAGDPARARMCIVESQTAGNVALARYEAMLESAVPKLREGRKLTPRAAALPGTLEDAIVGGIAWLVHQRLVMNEVDDVEALLPEVLQITLTPYLGESEAGRVAEAAAQERAA